jgi:hypothetical protein
MMSEESLAVAQRNKELEQEAIRMALEGRWEEAERLNRLLLDRVPGDVEALNRLGKALLELRHYDEAHAAYGRALELDPFNRIARKNRERLVSLLQTEREQSLAEAAEREHIRPDLFISESGKSAVVPLHGLAEPRVLQRLSRGEIVRLEASGHTVLVKTEDGVTLGRLDPRIGRRLAEFIEIGNHYAAAIADVDQDGIKVFVRETYQHPRLIGRLSFPPVAAAPAETVRPYIRDLGLLQEAFEAGLDEEEEEEETEETEEEMGLEEVEELDVGEEEILEESREEEEFPEDLDEDL